MSACDKFQLVLHTNNDICIQTAKCHRFTTPMVCMCGIIEVCDSVCCLKWRKFWWMGISIWLPASGDLEYTSNSITVYSWSTSQMD